MEMYTNKCNVYALLLTFHSEKITNILEYVNAKKINKIIITVFSKSDSFLLHQRFVFLQPFNYSVATNKFQTSSGRYSKLSKPTQFAMGSK